MQNTNQNETASASQNSAQLLQVLQALRKSLDCLSTAMADHNSYGCYIAKQFVDVEKTLREAIARAEGSK